MERGSYSKHGRRDKNMHYNDPRNSARQQYQDQQGSGTVNNFGGHQVQPSVPAPSASQMYAGMPHNMPSQIPSGAQPVYSSQQPQVDCYQIHTPPPPPAELFYASYGSVQMQPHVVPVAQGTMLIPHAPIKMNSSTSTNKPLDGNKSKCCKCGFNNTFWELELSNLEKQLIERNQIIYEKDRCIEEKDMKIKHLENELMSFKNAPSVNSASINNSVQNDSTATVDSKTTTQSKKQLSADAPEFKFHSAVPVVSANGDISKSTKHTDHLHDKKTEDCVGDEDGALPKDDDLNNNYEEQSEDLKVGNTSVSSVTPSDSSSVTTQDSPSYSRATKMASSDEAKRSESERSQHSNISVKKKKTSKDMRNDYSVEYHESKREPSHHQSGQYAGPSKQRDNRRVQSNQALPERRPLDRKGFGRSYRESVRTSVIKEVEGDLFQAPDDYSLAHCVGQDFRMGSGIAVEFRKRFKHVADLLSQRVHVGKVAYLEDSGRYIFYLVTKPVSTGKPTYDTFGSAVDDLKQKCQEFGVKKLAMPKIGCGLDRLNWHEVKQYLERTFQGTEIEIMVYYINQAGEKEGNQPPPKIAAPTPKTASYPLLTILDRFGGGSTAFVFFGTADDHMDSSGEKLDKRFRFAEEFKKAQKSEGTVVKMIRQKELIFALIVKNTEKDEFSFLNLEKCLNQLSAMLKEAQYEYVAFEAFEVPTDDVFVHKVLTMFCNYVHKHVAEVWVCWPPEVTDVHGYQRKEGGNVQYSSKPNY